MAEGLTKKQLKELKRLEKAQSNVIEQKNEKMKWIAISVISALFLILFVGTIFVAKNKNKPIESDQVAQIAEGRNIRKIGAKSGEATDSATAVKKEIMLVEYADIQCPACKQYHPIVTALLAAYPDSVSLTFKHFPLVGIHDNAQAAAIVAEAAGRQGKFFEMVDVMYEKQTEWEFVPDPQSKFEEFARGLKLDIDQLKKDQKDPAIEKQVNEDREEGIKNGVSGTPTFFMNGKRINSPASLDEFKKIIDLEMKSDEATKPEVSPTTASPATPDQLPLQQ